MSGPLDEYLEDIRKAQNLLGQLQILTERCSDAMSRVKDPPVRPKDEKKLKKEKLFYSTEDLTKELGVDRRKIGWLRKYGLLRGVKVGHSYRFFADDIRVFVNKYAKYDLSNEEKIEMAGALQRVRDMNEEKEKRRQLRELRRQR